MSAVKVQIKFFYRAWAAFKYVISFFRGSRFVTSGNRSKIAQSFLQGQIYSLNPGKTIVRKNRIAV
jgi:hypothetical protein